MLHDFVRYFYCLPVAGLTVMIFNDVEIIASIDWSFLLNEGFTLI